MNLHNESAPESIAAVPTGREPLPVLPDDDVDNPIAGRVGGLPEPVLTEPSFAGDAASHAQQRQAAEADSSFTAPDDAAAAAPAQASAQDDLEVNDEFDAEDYTPPTLAELCRTRASEYTLDVLQAPTTRTTTIERGTAELAAMRDELCDVAKRMLQASEYGVEVTEVAALVKLASGLQKQIGQDYRLIAQLEKHGP